MKHLVLTVVLSLFTYTIIVAQIADPNASVWGVYASGVGERLSPCMDPCWVTYTVAQTNDPSILVNIQNGTMAAVISNVNWYEATAQQRRFGRYFDDEPDGTWKCTSCETPKPDLSCPWNSTFGKIHWNKGYYGTTSKTISGKLTQKDGVWVYEGNWGRTNSSRSGKVYFTFSTPNKFSGYWSEGNSSKKNNWAGSGTCN